MSTRLRTCSGVTPKCLASTPDRFASVNDLEKSLGMPLPIALLTTATTDAGSIVSIRFSKACVSSGPRISMRWIDAPKPVADASMAFTPLTPGCPERSPALDELHPDDHSRQNRSDRDQDLLAEDQQERRGKEYNPLDDRESSYQVPFQTGNK